MKHLPWIGLAAAAVTAYYLRLLFGQVSIKWDAVCYFYPHQKHFADTVMSGRLPHWSGSVFSGFPFLADLQVGAWYPLNWPFFLIGIEPRTMFAEVWLHAVLAACSAYLLAERLLDNRRAGVLAGLIYAFSGFFAAHAEHITLFQTAAWFPLLLWMFIGAVEHWTARRAAVCVLAGGCVALAGHFQSALYLFTGVAVFAAARYSGDRAALKRAAALMLAVTAGSALLAAVQILPGAELAGESIRQRMTAAESPLGIAGPRSLTTIVWPNALRIFDEGPYSGPPDITQHYFYAGVAAVALALIGLFRSNTRLTLIALIALPALYAAGPDGGLFVALSRLPGFANVRGPSHAMFVCALGIALAAAAGWAWIEERWRRPGARAVLAALAVVCCADLYYWNMHINPLVFAPDRFERVFGTEMRIFEGWLAQAGRKPMERFSPTPEWAAKFPVTAPFAYPVESTSGLNPLQLARYDDYMAASRRNQALLKGLGVGSVVNDDNLTLTRLEGALPRFNFPARIVQAQDPKARLDRLDPFVEGVVEWGGVEESANGRATVSVLSSSETEYVLNVSASSGAVMRIAIPWYPAWRAEIGGRRAELFPMDHALMGMRIPAGEHRVRLVYVPAMFRAGALISLLALVACLAAVVRVRS